LLYFHYPDHVFVYQHGCDTPTAAVTIMSKPRKGSIGKYGDGITVLWEFSRP